jgi:hypothetical protein
VSAHIPSYDNYFSGSSCHVAALVGADAIRQESPSQLVRLLASGPQLESDARSRNVGYLSGSSANPRVPLRWDYLSGSWSNPRPHCGRWTEVTLGRRPRPPMKSRLNEYQTPHSTCTQVSLIRCCAVVCVPALPVFGSDSPSPHVSCNLSRKKLSNIYKRKTPLCKNHVP